MTWNRFIFLMFGVIFFAGNAFAKYPPGLFLSRFEAPDDFYNDESAFNERKYQDEQREYQPKSPWSKLVHNEFIRDHQPARFYSKNEADDSNLVNDFPEYSTEHLPMPQELIQNYVKERTAKKNSNQFAEATYMSIFHFKICNMGRKRNTRHLHLNNLVSPLPWRA